VVDDENQNSMGKFWGWYQAISFLAENKVWKIDSVTNLPLVACLNHLSFLMDYNKQQEEKIKQIQNK
jgi:hypothetical protein